MPRYCEVLRTPLLRLIGLICRRQRFKSLLLNESSQSCSSLLMPSCNGVGCLIVYNILRTSSRCAILCHLPDRRMTLDRHAGRGEHG